jgi:hypothetical protein
MKAKTLTHLSAARQGSTYQLHIEDEAGKKALFELTARQALRLADVLDSLLADEEEEMGLTPPACSRQRLPRAARGGEVVQRDQGLWLCHAGLRRRGAVSAPLSS